MKLISFPTYFSHNAACNMEAGNNHLWKHGGKNKKLAAEVKQSQLGLLNNNKKKKTHTHLGFLHCYSSVKILWSRI